MSGDTNEASLLPRARHVRLPHRSFVSAMMNVVNACILAGHIDHCSLGALRLALHKGEGSENVM